MAAVHRPEDLKLELLDSAQTPGGSGESIKLQVLSGTEPYVHVTEVSPGYRIHSHSHSENEVTIVLSGSARVGDRVCGAGTILIVPAGEEYSLIAGDDEPLRFAVVRPRKAAYALGPDAVPEAAGA
jgi:quercetin dioxygenase-like cupin family protein